MEGPDEHPPSRTADSSVINKRVAVFSESSFPLLDSGHINSTVSHARVSISMMLSQPNKRQVLLTNTSSLPLVIASKKEKDVLEIADTQPR